MNKKTNKCIHLDSDDVTCLIANIPCEKVVICTPECVYIDKEDEPANLTENGDFNEKQI